ncbi:MAG: helix-turn-helix domain-containing protein [Culicoidibacterales bacterium]
MEKALFVDQQLKETVSHGTSFLPIKIYLNQPLSPQVSLYTHWHDSIEVVACIKGTFEMTIEHETFLVHAGEYVIVNQAALHAACSYQEQESVHHALIFDLKLLHSFLYDATQSQFLDPILNKELLFPKKIDRSTPWGARCCTEFDEIFQQYDSKKFGWELCVKANMLKVISLLVLEQQFLTTTITTRITSEKTQMIKSCIDYLQQHYQEKIALTQLAQLINVSPEYFCRFFKTHTGMTAIAYLHEIRIEAATQLLLHSDLSMLAISLQVGFDDPSYFTKKFRQRKGVTPAQFRKQYATHT